jgi:hypothetical protein
MKSMLDTLIQSGVQDPIVGGILVKGYQLSTYKICFEHPAVYTLVPYPDFSSIIAEVKYEISIQN